MTGNLVASARARLTNLARERKENIDLVFMRYGLERLLYRLSQSPYSDRFLLKGAYSLTFGMTFRTGLPGMRICWASARTIFPNWRRCFVPFSPLKRKTG